jgi:hypothetical protein
MTRLQSLVLGLVVAALLGGWLWLQRGDPLLHTDLLAAFDDADKESSMDLEVAFGTTIATIQGQTKPAIAMHPDSTLIYEQVRVPERATLRTWIALKPGAWERGGDGVVFRVGVRDGGTYTPLATRHVDPGGNPDDRTWIPLTIDLDSYAGRPIDLVFHTDGSPAGHPPNLAWDWAIWGKPAIVLTP